MYDIRTPPLKNSRTWSGWTCDDLTPAFCPLDVERGQVLVRGINITYWIYSRADVNFDGDEISPKLLPIVIIHGGPAFPHNYMLPLQQQACRGRIVIFYDQGGCGESKAILPTTTIPITNVSTEYPWLLTTSYYVEEELPQLIEHLRLEKFHIIGHSWGTMLAQSYALDLAATKSQTPQLVSMVLSGPISDSKLYIQAQWDKADGSLGTLPPYMQRRIHELEVDNAYQSPEYQAIDQTLTSFFTCRTYPLPDCYVASVTGTNAEIYTAMNGPSEFTNAGVLEEYNVTARLSTELSKLPVLLTSGKYDTVRPSVVKTMYEQLPLSEWVLLTKSGHASMIDQPGSMNDAIADFLDRVEESEAVNNCQAFVPNRRGVMMDHSQQLSSVETNFTTNMKQRQLESAVNLVVLIFITLVSMLAGWLLGSYCTCRRQRAQYTPIISYR